MRWFRRDPPHLRGRVPVDCGEGSVPSVAVSNEVPAWPTLPDDAGRAFLASAPPLNPLLTTMAEHRELFAGGLPKGW
jgi:hypothetical protein